MCPAKYTLSGRSGSISVYAPAAPPQPNSPSSAAYEHTRPPCSQRRVQEIPQARMDVGFVAVEHVLGEVHAELALGVDQCIRARRAAPAELAQRRGLPEHTRPSRSQRRVQEIPQARMDVGFAAVEHVLGEVHAERTFGVDQRLHARHAHSAAYRRLRRRGWT